MKYKRIPFNITLAKRISDGSVCGKIIVENNDKEVIGTAVYCSQAEETYMFEITGFDSPDNCYLKAFDKQGFNINGGVATLVIEIPVEDSYEKNEPCDASTDCKDLHYHKCKIEPIDYILANNLGFCEGNVVKYITRYKDKGGVDDLRKIKVYVDYLIDELDKR